MGSYGLKLMHRILKNIPQITDEEFVEKTEDEKAEVVENVLSKGTKEPELTTNKGEYGIIPMVPVESFMNVFQTPCCGKSCVSIFLKSMEEMGLREGFLAYTTKLKKDVDENSVLKGSVRDRAYLIINMTELIGLIEGNTEFKLPKALEEGTKITFLVENLGRGAYEPGKPVTKGLFNMYLNNEYLDNWIITTCSVNGRKTIEKLHNLLRKKLRDKIKPSPPPTSSNTQSLWLGTDSNSADQKDNKPFVITPPAFYYGTFTNDKDDSPDNKKNRDLVHELDLESDINYDNLGDVFQDSYLNLTGWKKGVVYLNEWCLGRYWCVGPQQTLFVPGSYIRPYPWKNRITIVELLAAPKDPKVNFVPQHIYATAPEEEPKETKKEEETLKPKEVEEVAARSGENVGDEPQKGPENVIKEGGSNQSVKQAKTPESSQPNVATEPAKENENVPQETENVAQEVDDTPPKVEDELPLN